ncbi:hypothetical protein NFI96_012910 [Prochilodus magdalenae]|nr:hypothetical protein NFI96_012910 [Prochilodus magdalenae]
MESSDGEERGKDEEAEGADLMEVSDGEERGRDEEAEGADLMESSDGEERGKDEEAEEAEGTSTESRRCLRVTAVCLGLLCVLLLTAITVLCIKLNNLTVERDQLQPNCTSLAVERDQLQTSYTKLEFSYMEAVNERDQLKEKLRSADGNGEINHSVEAQGR